MPSDSFHSFFNDDLGKDRDMPSVSDDLRPVMEADSAPLAHHTLAESGERIDAMTPSVPLSDPWPTDNSEQQVNCVDHFLQGVVA